MIMFSEEFEENFLRMTKRLFGVNSERRAFFCSSSLHFTIPFKSWRLLFGCKTMFWRRTFSSHSKRTLTVKGSWSGAGAKFSMNLSHCWRIKASIFPCSSSISFNFASHSKESEFTSFFIISGAFSLCLEVISDSTFDILSTYSFLNFSCACKYLSFVSKK